MFRLTDPQGSLFETSNLLPGEKLKRLESTWAWQFRQHALTLIDENLFRELYCADNGCPNKPVQTVVGILVLKDMFDLTDEESLAELEFDLRWQAALGLTPEDAHCCQKTLHNFRAKLLCNDKVKMLFAEMTSGMLKTLGLSVERQRLDSTHIVSNIARLTRLGLFCETNRLFLRALKKAAPDKFQLVPESLRGRYIKEDGEDSSYHDAKSVDTRRRLEVAARDVYRMSERFKADRLVLKMPSYGVLVRLMLEQCEITSQAVEAKADDADAHEPAEPVILKESKEISTASLQSPHDIDATYSGHKGKGYEVQIAETAGNGEKPEMITYVEVTPSCKSDEAATVPAVLDLAARDLQPDELIADTGYGSAANVQACEHMGTELVAPVKGSAPEQEAGKNLADFKIGAPLETICCAAGHAAESQERDEKSGSIVARFAKIHCAHCPFKRECAAKRMPNGTRELRTNVKAHLLARRRAYEQTEEFRKRYAERSGIEATNSELKRAHGLGKLRVRGGKRVKLAVYFKALACNVKRMVKYLAEEARKAARVAAASQKACATALFDCFGRHCAPRRAPSSGDFFQPTVFPRALAA